jgi:hypothetical protein
MFEIALKYLANPMFFAGFSVVIGVAYVVVWVISLKEIVRPAPQSIFQPVRRNPEYDIQEQRYQARGSNRRNDRVTVRRKDVAEKSGQRGRKAARAA